MQPGFLLSSSFWDTCTVYLHPCYHLIKVSLNGNKVFIFCGTTACRFSFLWVLSIKICHIRFKFCCTTYLVCCNQEVEINIITHFLFLSYEMTVHQSLDCPRLIFHSRPEWLLFPLLSSLTKTEYQIQITSLEWQVGQHVGTLSPHSDKVVGSILGPDLSLWSLHVLPVSARVPSRCSGFLLPSKDM